MSVRLDRLLANLGYGSRRDVQAMARAGEVVLDGKPLTDSAAKVDAGPDLPRRMTVAGRPVDPPAPLSLVMHKPAGLVCSHREPGRNVYELLPRRWRARDPALSTIGRLDADTTGLLLITDDGGLLHRVISPRSAIPKRYRATLARPLKGDEGPLFASGQLLLESEMEPCAPAVLEPLSPTLADLVITEGRYHQVRRMFAAVGNHVEELHRVSIGALALPEDLAAGQWRAITAGELSSVFA